jgi:hypothetical protein
MAKSFYRYCALIFRDHGMSWDLIGWIPGGVCTPVIGELRAVISQARLTLPIPRYATELETLTTAAR